MINNKKYGVIIPLPLLLFLFKKCLNSNIGSKKAGHSVFHKTKSFKALEQ